MNTPKHFYNIEKLPEETKALAAFHSVKVDSRVKLFGALSNLFRSESYLISRFHSKEFAEALRTVLSADSFDVVQLEGITLAQYIPVIRNHCRAKVVLRMHNVEHEIWQRESLLNPNWLKRWYYLLTANRLEEFEREHFNSFDAIVPISGRDAEWIVKQECTVPLFTSEYGVDLNELKADSSSASPYVFHIGSMDWQPNLYGVQWMIDKVWPLVLKQIPEAKLFLAGRNFPAAWLSKGSDNIIMAGEVDDEKEFMRDKPVMAVPLFAGSGVRIKLIEAMAAGKAVVTTSVGAEGIEGKHERDWMLSDNPAEFAQHLIRCLSDKKLQQQLGRNARKFAEEHFDYLKLGRDLLHFYKEKLLA